MWCPDSCLGRLCPIQSLRDPANLPALASSTLGKHHYLFVSLRPTIQYFVQLLASLLFILNLIFVFCLKKIAQTCGDTWFPEFTCCLAWSKLLVRTPTLRRCSKFSLVFVRLCSNASILMDKKIFPLLL